MPIELPDELCNKTERRRKRQESEFIVKVYWKSLRGLKCYGIIHIIDNPVGLR